MIDLINVNDYVASLAKIGDLAVCEVWKQFLAEHDEIFGVVWIHTNSYRSYIEFPDGEDFNVEGKNVSFPKIMVHPNIAVGFAIPSYRISIDGVEHAILMSVDVERVFPAIHSDIEECFKKLLLFEKAITIAHGQDKRIIVHRRNGGVNANLLSVHSRSLADHKDVQKDFLFNKKAHEY